MNTILLDVIKKIFPSFDPYVAEQMKESILKKESNEVFLSQANKDILQGDIFQDIDFIFYTPEGKPTIVKTYGMVISNTCDITRNENLLFVPLIPASEKKVSVGDLRSNIIYNLFYIPEFQEGKYLINFDYIQSFPRGFLESKYKEKRVFSLTQYGFYFLVIKLSIFLMRVETEDIKRE